jgi:hypothetical protein
MIKLGVNTVLFGGHDLATARTIAGTVVLSIPV